MDGAGSIALGLDWRSGVYVQQLWERGELEYLVFNERAEDIDVLVEHGCLPSDTGEKLEPCAVTPVAGPWHVPAASHEIFPASEFTTPGRWLFFRLATGERLGLLEPAVAPLPSSLRLISNEGPNGDGGVFHDIQIETDFLVAPAASFTITLVVPSDTLVEQNAKLMLPWYTEPTESVQYFAPVAARSSLGEVKQTSAGLSIDIPNRPDPDVAEGPVDTSPIRIEVDLALPADFACGRLAAFRGWLCRREEAGECVTSNGVSRAIPLR